MNNNLISLSEDFAGFAISFFNLLPRPIISKRDAISQQIADSLSKARSNYSYKTDVIRLVVAKSGDIAYEFGNGVLNFDEVNKKNITVNNSYVRTWKKVNGQWMIDIFFARPNR